MRRFLIIDEPDQPDSRVSRMKSAFTFELNFRIMTYEDVTPMFPLLGWEPTVSFKELIQMMVEADLKVR